MNVFGFFNPSHCGDNEKRIKFVKKGNQLMAKITGIIGGMGPMTTVDLMKRVIELTPTQKEQDNIRMLVDNRPEIPDRTGFIKGDGNSPVPYLIDSVRLLEKWGADFIAIACNTAHVFIEEIQNSISIPVLNLPKILVESLKKKYALGSEIILLATSGTIGSKLYTKCLTDFNVLIPGEESQESDVMEAIYGEQGVKKSHQLEWGKNKLISAIEKLRTENTKAVITGCTEISLAFEGSDYDLPLLDPLDFLAKKIVDEALS